MIISGQFNDSLPPIMDGVAITAQNYAYWLNKNHAPSFTIGPRIPNYSDNEVFTLRYRSLRTIVADPYRLGFPRVDRSFNKTIETVPFDLVHAHCPFVSGNYAFTLARKRNIPLVATFHSKYREDFASWMHLEIPIEQALRHVVRFYEQADSVWVPNEAIIETLRDYGYKGSIEYMPNGSDIALRDSDDTELLASRGHAIIKTDEKTPVLLYLGQLRWVKNLKLLIESLAYIRELGIGFQMRFIGNGGDDEEIKSLVTDLHLDNEVKFVGPVYDRNDLRAILAAGDLFLFPSLYDNASLATREAAGFYIPTLFIRGATTANGIIDGQNGFLAENRVEKYGEKIAMILKDRITLESAGAGARQSLYIPWKDIAHQVYEKYSEIVDKYKYRQLSKITHMSYIPIKWQ